MNLFCAHADFPGTWTPGHGYDAVLPGNFTTPGSLATAIAGFGARNSIQRLGLLLHGDEGHLQFGDRGGTPAVGPDEISSDASLSSALGGIRDHLADSAEVVFYSCSAGASERGSRLLVLLSQIWPGRTVVGSITKGYRFATLTAGDLKDTLLTYIEQVPRTDEYFIPGQSTRAGRSQFMLPPGLPPFATPDLSCKRAKNGHTTVVPSARTMFSELERVYPAETLGILFDHPVSMEARRWPRTLLGWGRTGEVVALPGDNFEVYANNFINIDGEVGAGSRAMLSARGHFPDW